MRARLALAFLLLPLTVPAQERPLPNPETFLAAVRERLQRDEVLQSGYAYVETRREERLDKHGRTTAQTVKVFETYPGLPGERRWKRLVEENGVPVTPAELASRDRERQRKVEDKARKLAAETDEERETRRRKREADRREQAEEIEEIFRIFQVRMLRREAIDGHETIVLSLTPRPDARPRTRAGRIIRHFVVTAWVSETEHELVRVEGEAVGDVTWGKGLAARLHKGSRASFERRKVNGDAWLPVTASYTMSGRLLLVRRLRVRSTSEFSNYRKFVVGTESTYTLWEQPPD